MKLPSMEFTFDVNLKGSVTQEVFKGSFTYKRLTIGDQSKAEILKVRLNGDLSNIDSEIDKLNEMLSWLRYGLIDYPSWWRDSGFGVDLYDINVLVDIYTQVTNFEKKWTEKVKTSAASNA